LGLGARQVDLVRLLANAAHLGGRPVQDAIGACGGVEGLLSHCTIDGRNPFLREWAIFGVRNLTLGHLGNNAVYVCADLHFFLLSFSFSGRFLLSFSFCGRFPHFVHAPSIHPSRASERFHSSCVVFVWVAFDCASGGSRRRCACPENQARIQSLSAQGVAHNEELRKAGARAWVDKDTGRVRVGPAAAPAAAAAHVHAGAQPPAPSDNNNNSGSSSSSSSSRSSSSGGRSAP
jgi:hypothetical protein